MVRKRLLAYMLLGIVVIVSVTFVYFFWFRKSTISWDTSLWGGFGSYIGGTAGALLSFISIMLLYETLRYQIDSNMNAQLGNIFFELFKLHKELTNRIKGDIIPYVPGGVITMTAKSASGEEYFELLASEFDKKFDSNYLNIQELYMSLDDYKKRSSISKQSAFDSINTKYDQLFEGRESDLGHYFRSLFHIIKYVHESTSTTKKKYIDLIQAYLTDAELYLIFYNGIGRYGNEKFLPLLDYYSFFENIKTRGPIFEYHFEQFYPKTYLAFINKPRPT